MIDVSNLKDTLKTLGFIAYGDIYEKAFSEIAKNEKVKGCVRVAIANALNDGEIALSDSQRLQSILIKHFC